MAMARAILAGGAGRAGAAIGVVAGGRRMIPLLGGGRRLTELGACIPPHETAVTSSASSAATWTDPRPDAAVAARVTCPSPAPPPSGRDDVPAPRLAQLDQPSIEAVGPVAGGGDHPVDVDAVP